MPAATTADITANGVCGGEGAVGTRAYVCPGETHPISRAVHLARLAAYFPACRTCAHRGDTGNLPRQVVARIDRSALRKSPTTLVKREGIRGTYLNELSRPQAELYAEAFASILWEKFPMTVRREDQPPAMAVARRRPTVVLGQDRRTSSPDIAVGAAAALRRMGCDVVDVGVVSTPCFQFAVEHLKATGGVYVTGQGCGAAAAGVDFAEEGGHPWSSGGSLERLEDLTRRPIVRPTRRGGLQTTFRADVPYLEGLQNQFRGVGPLRIGVICLAPEVQPLLNGLCEPLVCRLRWIPCGMDLEVGRADVLARLARVVRDEQLHAGFLIGDDGQSIVMMDERGRAIATPALLHGLLLPSGESGMSLVLDESFPKGESTRLAARGWRLRRATGTRQEMGRVRRDADAAIAADSQGRFWFADQSPQCDALPVLARLLKWLSLSGVPASLLWDD